MTVPVASLSVHPVTLAFKDISYTVALKGGANKVLLNAVTGYALPGTLTALMGSTGTVTHWQ